MPLPAGGGILLTQELNMYGFTSESESVKLRQCLLEISAAGPKLYSENEKHLLKRVSKSTVITQHESNVIYAIHCRITVEKEPVVQVNKVASEPKKPGPVPKNRQWMTL